MSIQIKQLKKAFGEKKVLRGVDMTLEDDRIYCLMGPSGMGKTTLLRILLGREAADSGTIEGISPGEISAMFQEDRLCQPLTAVENVALVCEGKSNRKELAEELCQILPENCLNQPVSQLSGGMKRRVALARAIHYSSRMVILDEPFTGLDRKTRMEVISYILNMRRGRTLLIATHGVDDAALLGAETLRMEDVQGEKGEEEAALQEPEVSREEILCSLKIFDGVAPEQCEALIAGLHGYERKYREQDIIWEQNEQYTAMGIVLKGSIQATNISRDEPQIIQQFHAGSCFGEAVAFGGQFSWAGIRAITPARILFLPAAGILEREREDGVSILMRNLLKEMSAKVGILNVKNQLLSEPRLRARILMYLHTLKEDSNGWRQISFSHKELAQYLNVNRSAFSRELSRMKEEGVLKVNGKRVKLLQDKENF